MGLSILLPDWRAAHGNDASKLSRRIEAYISVARDANGQSLQRVHRRVSFDMLPQKLDDRCSSKLNNSKHGLARYEKTAIVLRALSILCRADSGCIIFSVT